MAERSSDGGRVPHRGSDGARSAQSSPYDGNARHRVDGTERRVERRTPALYTPDWLEWPAYDRHAPPAALELVDVRGDTGVAFTSACAVGPSGAVRVLGEPAWWVDRRLGSGDGLGVCEKDA